MKDMGATRWLDMGFLDSQTWGWPLDGKTWGLCAPHTDSLPKGFFVQFCIHVLKFELRWMLRQRQVMLRQRQSRQRCLWACLELHWLLYPLLILICLSRLMFVVVMEMLISSISLCVKICSPLYTFVVCSGRTVTRNARISVPASVSCCHC